MVSFGKHYPTLSDYEKDNYYLKDKSYISSLKGNIAKKLGLTNIDGSIYKSLSLGLNPFDNSVLVKSRNDGKRRSGFDLTFAPHKSVSVAYAFARDMNLKNSILEAHNKAVEEAMKYAEQNLVLYKKCSGVKTTTLQSNGGLLYFFVNHNINRDKEPQLHTHTVVFNITYAEGKYKAVETKAIFYYRKMLDAIYQNALARNLIEAGIRIEFNERGDVCIDGIKKEVCDVFSSRKKAIREYIEKAKNEYENIDFLIKKVAVLTRKEKDIITEKEMFNLYKGWNEKAFVFDKNLVANGSDYYIKQDSLFALRREKYKDFEIKQELRNIINSIHNEKSVFTKNEIIEKAIRKLYLLNSDEVKQEVEKFLKEETENQNICFLNKKCIDRNLIEEIYASTSSIQLERKVFDFFKSYEDKKSSLIDVKENHFVKSDCFINKTLTKSQKKAVLNVLFNNSGLSVIVGDAGVGKTTLLKEIACQIGQERLFALAPTGVATKEIKNKSGIESITIDKLIENPRKFDVKNKVLIIDECSMISIQKFERLIDELKINNNMPEKIVLIGDPKQLPPVKEREVFTFLSENLKAVSIDENVRVQNKELKTLVEYVNTAIKQKSETYLNSVFEKLNITEVEQDERFSHIDMIVNSYIEKIQEKKDVLCLFETREDRDEFNRRIHEIYRDKSNYREYSFYISYQDEAKELRLCKGEKVVFKENEYRYYNVRNGDEAIFLGLDERNKLVFQLSDRVIHVDENIYNAFDYAYSRTIHSSQGFTADYTIAYLNNCDRKQFYVAMTRAREDIEIFTNDIQNLQLNVKKSIFAEDVPSALLMHKKSIQEKEYTRDLKIDVENLKSFKI